MICPFVLAFGIVLLCPFNLQLQFSLWYIEAFLTGIKVFLSGCFVLEIPQPRLVLPSEQLIIDLTPPSTVFPKPWTF